MSSIEKNKPQKRSGAIPFRWFVREFGKTLKLPKCKPPQPIILASAGPSRVGKTGTMKFIEKRLPYFVRISHDAIRLFLYRRGWADSPRVENFIYRKRPSYNFAEKFLRKGYSVIIDDNFASKPIKLILAQGLAKKFKTGFFVIRVWAPVNAVRRRLRGGKSALFPDWRVGLDHFERSRKEFNYKNFDKLYLARINTAQPFESQLKQAMRKLNDAMGL